MLATIQKIERTLLYVNRFQVNVKIISTICRKSNNPYFQIVIAFDLIEISHNQLTDRFQVSVSENLSVKIKFWKLNIDRMRSKIEVKPEQID